MKYVSIDEDQVLEFLRLMREAYMGAENSTYRNKCLRCIRWLKTELDVEHEPLPGEKPKLNQIEDAPFVRWIKKMEESA